MKLYIGSLPYSATESDLTMLFSTFGEVGELSLATDRDTGNSKGFAFIEMKRNADADKAIKTLNGSIFQGRTIKVNQVQAKAKSKSVRWRPGM